MTRRTRQRSRRSPTTLAVGLGLLAALLLLPLAFAPRADAYVYWINNVIYRPQIGRANLDGSGAQQQFLIPAAPSPAVLSDLTVDTKRIYWINYRYIGRASLDGTRVDERFMTIGGSGYVEDLAVDNAHVYWTQNAPSENGCETGAIGRANLDGSFVDPTFLSPGTCANGLVVDHAHIYWVGASSIGRADIDGSGVEPTFILPDTGTLRSELAVDDAHVYWAYLPQQDGVGGTTIARANIDGSGVDESFISGLPLELSGLAVTADHIYWTDFDGAIGRANVDGSDVDQTFIPGNNPAAIAVDGLRTPRRTTAKPTQRQSDKTIRVELKVRADDRLTAWATGKVDVKAAYKLRPKKFELAARETRTLRLKPKKAASKRITAALERGKKATAKLEVKFTDRAGNSETEKLSVRLKR